MSDFDIKKYLKKLGKTLEDKELNEFFVMVDRTDFKPIKGGWTETLKMFKERASYYAGKRTAYISMGPHTKNLKYYEGSSKDKIKPFIFSLKIVIYEIKEDGTLNNFINNVVGVTINYEPDDFEERPFHIKDVETFMRLCADGKLYIDTLNGQWYKKIIKMLRKKGIDFDNY